MQKDIQYGALLGFYGKLLSERQRQVMEQYYIYDNSLAEISEQFGITRQSVHDAIKKGQQRLQKYERTLCFLNLTYGVTKELRQVLTQIQGHTQAEKQIAAIIHRLEE